jgi:hypothetical protein
MYVTAVIRSPIGRFEPVEPPDLAGLTNDASTPADKSMSLAPTSGTIYAKSSTTQVGSYPSLVQGEMVEGYTCIMHPEYLQEHPGRCTLCDCGMQMTKWRREQVLAVPDSAVIDTGTHKFVYVEKAPGVFDAHIVLLGARAQDYYPVLRGLDPGMSIASTGSFLIDAENRLNPASGMNKLKPKNAQPDFAIEHTPTIIVKAGFSPDVLRLDPEQPRRIVFDRQETGECTSKVVFPSLGIEKELPAFQKTEIELPTTATGTIEYACGMDMVHGKILMEK